MKDNSWRYIFPILPILPDPEPAKINIPPEKFTKQDIQSALDDESRKLMIEINEIIDKVYSKL